MRKTASDTEYENVQMPIADCSAFRLSHLRNPLGEEVTTALAGGKVGRKCRDLDPEGDKQSYR